MRLDGQNGRTATAEVVMATPCRLAIAASSHTASALAVTVGGLAAGRVAVSGPAIARTTRTIKDATTATIHASRDVRR